jgi:hypothetical protein
VVRAYVEWLGAQSAASFDAYYTEPRARFEPRGGDVLHAPGDVQVNAAACGARVSSGRASASVEVCGVRAADGARLFDAIDGARTADEVRRAAGLEDDAWSVLMASLFGTVVFAPLSVGALEARAPSAEIVRFPGSPYEIVRPYWENMGLLRERLAAANGDLGTALADTASFIRLLRELHALVLVGEGASFYRPASPVAAKERFEPGELATAPVVTEASAAGLRFVSGLRVSASPLGGPHYVPLLLEGAGAEAAHDAAASALRDAGQAPGAPDWGRVVVARADADARSAPWFCPPRPLQPSHFEALASHLATALAASRRGDEDVALARVAAFHRGFVRLHPFGFANQCLAMALVNHVLSSLFGAGLSHLVLDHLALELPPAAYAVVFRRAVRAWLSKDPNPVHRTLDLAHKKTRCFAFMRALALCPSAEEARRLLRERSEDARLAFL